MSPNTASQYQQTGVKAKETALKMIDMMMGVSDDQKESLRNAVKSIPDEYGVEAVKLLEKSQRSISKKFQQGHSEIKKLRTHQAESIQKEFESESLRNLEKEIDNL